MENIGSCFLFLMTPPPPPKQSKRSSAFNSDAHSAGEKQYLEKKGEGFFFFFLVCFCRVQISTSVNLRSWAKFHVFKTHGPTRLIHVAVGEIDTVIN